MTPRNPIRSLLKSAAEKLGYAVHLRNEASDPMLQLVRSLESFSIDLVFDIGANTGQFSRSLRDRGFSGRIVSIEPLSSAHLKLVRASRGDDLWTVHRRCALGDAEGESAINIAGNSVSSSLLSMTDLHQSAAAGSSYIGHEPVAVCRLDDLARLYLQDSQRPFVKIDAQGFEWEILDGAQRTLPQVQGVLCELSLVPLYEGQRLWRDVISRLEDAGFTLWALKSGFIDRSNGRSLQLDGTFFRITA